MRSAMSLVGRLYVIICQSRIVQLSLRLSSNSSLNKRLLHQKSVCEMTPIEPIGWRRFSIKIFVLGRNCSKISSSAS